MEPALVKLTPELEQRLVDDGVLTAGEIPLVRRQLREGSATVLRYDDPELHLIVRAEKRDGVPELCVVAAHGRGLVTHWPHLREFAQLNGFAYVRGHTKKRGVARLLERLGWYEWLAASERRSDRIFGSAV